MSRVGDKKTTGIVGPSGVTAEPLKPTKVRGSVEVNAPTSYSALRLRLAQKQLDLRSASVNLKAGLKSSPTIETDPAMEQAASDFWRGVALGGLAYGDKEATQEKLTAFTQTLSVDALPAFLDVLDAQRSTVKTELSGEAAGLFEQASSAALDEVAAGLFQSFDFSAAQTDHKAAMKAMLTTSEVLNLGFSPTAVYPAVDVAYEATNSFTNEPGLPKLVRRVDPKGGALVGVSGAAFDIASMGSSFLVSVDANPKIRHTIQVFTAVLLAVDKLCQQRGWDDTKRAEEVLGRLMGGSSAQLRQELLDVGLPGHLRDALPELLQAVGREITGQTTEAAPIPQDLWCKGELAPQRVAHLTRLALEGRIVALTGDLADPRVSDRVNGLLRAHGAETKIVHFSNALDYIPDIQGACEVFGKLDLMPGARLTTSAGTRLMDPINVSKPDYYIYAQMLGTIEDPPDHDAAQWLGSDGIGAKIHEAVWEVAECQRNLLFWTARICRVDPFPLEAKTPRTVGQYKELMAEIEQIAFADPDNVKEFVLADLKERGRFAAYADIAPDALDKLLQPGPKTFAEVPEVADRIDAAFWAAGDRKLRYVTQLLAGQGVTAKRVPELNDRVAECRNFEELRNLEGDLLRSFG